MAETDIKITGLKELYDKLQQLPEKMEKRVMAKAMRQGTNVFMRSARENAPVKTGALKKSIKTKSLRGRRGEVKFGAVASAPYAHLVEFGTAQHLIEAGKNRRGSTGKKVLADGKGRIFGKSVMHKGSKMKPFMRPAFDENTDEAIEMFRSIVEQNLKDLIT
jgi:HK97 gp10 family phage protein